MTMTTTHQRVAVVAAGAVVQVARVVDVTTARLEALVVPRRLRAVLQVVQPNLLKQLRLLQHLLLLLLLMESLLLVQLRGHPQLLLLPQCRRRPLIS